MARKRDTKRATTWRWPADLAVLIPVYNHAHHITRVIRGVAAYAPRVVVIDDGSTDGSGERAAAAGAEVITLAANGGKARALAIGMEHLAAAGWQRVLTCDADGQHPLFAIRRLAAAACEHPERLWLGVRSLTQAPGRSRLGRWACNLAITTATGHWPHDSQTGLRVYPWVHLRNCLGNALFHGDGFAWEAQILIAAQRAGIRLEPCLVPALYPSTRISHFRPLHDTLVTIAGLARSCLSPTAPSQGPRPGERDDGIRPVTTP